VPAARPYGSLLEWCFSLKTRPVAVLKKGVTRLDGQLVDPRTGVVLTPEEAYETAYGKVRQEPLGTRTTDGMGPRRPPAPF
jgi:hypothetical protein